MKLNACLIALSLAALPAMAGPLQKTHVADNAKWILHLDVEKLLTTQLGGYVGRTIMDKQLAKPTRDLEQWGINFDWRDIESITAYGVDFTKGSEEKGVLLVKSSFDFAGALDTVIERISGTGSRDVEKLQSEPFPLYAAKGEVFGTPFGKDLFLISKSRPHLESARSVLNGKAANLTSAKTLSGLNGGVDGFFVAAVAGGFQTVMKLPPQANGLKNAESGQIVAGENADKVFVSLSVNTKDAESATQMQQVLQGLLALAALSQEQNKDLALLVQGAKVGGAEKTVTVNLEMPSETVIAKVGEKHTKRRK